MTELQLTPWGTASSDAELITAVRAGDTTAYGALYERHASAARTVAMQYVRSSADADDVVADAFARTLGVLQNGGGPDVTFRAYLFTVVRRLSYDLVNGARRTQPTDDERTFESAFGPMASTEDPTLEGFERSIVARAYQALPERWRAVLWYTEVENLPPAEIAPILGLTANGVAALSYRAREGLRQAYLQQHLNGEAAQECQGVNGLLGSYVRGGLAKRETARVESHLDGCTDCRGLVLELGDVSHGMRAVIAPLVLGVGALGLVGTALPVVGGSAVGAGAVGAGAGGATAGGATAGGAAVGAGGTTAGGAVAGAGAGGASAAGAAAGAGGAAGAGAAAGGAAGAGAAAGATAAAGAGAAASGGGLALAAGGGLVALVSSAPVASAAVAIGVLAVTGLGVAGALGVFTPSEPTPTSTVAPTPTPTVTDGTTAPVDPTPSTEPSQDPTSPTNIPPAQDPDPATGDGTGTGDGTVVAQPPGTPTTGGGTVVPPSITPTDPSAPTFPSTPTPSPTAAPTDPPAPPEPAPAALDLALGTVELEARVVSALPVTTSNTGGSAADDVVVDIILPAGVTTEPPASARGAAVVPVLTAEALPCGAAIPSADGTSVVRCVVGTLAAGATEDVVVNVWAQDGGEYWFSGAVRATGIEPVVKTFRPRTVAYFGPQVRVTPSSGVPTPVANPGVATVDLAVRNSGDRPATDPVVSLTVPSGLSLVTGSGGTQDVAGWTCTADGGTDVTCAAPSGTTLEAKETVTLPVRVLAHDRAVGGPTARVIEATGTAAGARDGGTRDVLVEVRGHWAGAEEGLGEAVEPQCTAPGAAGTASLVVEEFTNLTAYDDLDVTLAAAGSTATRELGSGETADLVVDDGVRFPAGTATLELSTTIAGTTYTHRVDAGTFPATDCWSVPRWLGSADVTAENVDGTVRYAAHVRNDTGTAMDVRLLAPAQGPWADVADSAAVAPLRAGSPADLVLDTGRASMPAGTATLRQYRFHTDADGDGKGYQSLLSVDLPAETIAPSAARPTVGACVFDRGTDTSGAPVALLLDNTASTLPVTFAVPGVQEPVRVAGGATRSVTTTVGADDAVYDVRADGRTLETFTVPGVDCFDWSVIGDAASARAAWAVGKGGSTGSTVLTGTFRNDYAATTLRVTMSAGGLGTTDAVDVAPGDEATFTLGVRSRDVAAGSVTFTAERPAAAAGVTSMTTTAPYAASSYEPGWATSASSATVDAVWQDGSVKLVGTFTNTSSETVDARMLGGAYGDSTPVQKIAPGESATFTIDTRSLDVPPGHVSFRQYRWVIDKGFADTSLRASHDGARYVPRWATTASVDAVWQDGSVKLVGTFTNDSPETVDARMLGSTYGDSTPIQRVAPGQSATFTIDTRSLDVRAGSVSFRQYRSVLGKGFADTSLRASHDGAAYVPDWSATPAAEATCTGDLDAAVALTGTLGNDSAEAVRVVASSVLGTQDLGVVAPGETAAFETGSGKIALGAGSVTFTLSREHLGRTFTHTVTADHAALDCTRVAPAADLVLGDAYYDDARDHSYRAVSVVLDNSGSNVPVTFAVAGSSQGSWRLAAGETRTQQLAEASWAGASYTVTAGTWSRTLGVAGFSAAPQCHQVWRAGTWYDHSESVSYRGWNYAARNSGILVRPDGALGRLFWERESRCGEG